MGMLEGWRMLWGGEEHSLVVTNQLWNQAGLSSCHASANYQLHDLSASGGQSTGVSALASFLPKNTQGLHELANPGECLKWTAALT